MRVLDRGVLSGAGAPEMRGLEAEFAAFLGGGHCLATNSGTAALHIALGALGLAPGDEVIVPAFSFIATAQAVLHEGAVPVFADVDPVTYNIDPADAAARVTARTRAIVPVHLHGLPADMDAVNALAARTGLSVIEDAAQAHGAEYRGRRCGTMGDMAAFSFYPSKNLGACGEGGAVVTSRPEYAATVRMLRDWGQGRKYEHRIKGFNFRMDVFQGAILRVKLRHLERWTERFRVDGAEVAPGELAAAIEHLRPAVEALREAGGETVPSFFDASTAAALWFRKMAITSSDLAPSAAASAQW